MKQSKKLLSILLAMIMLLGSVSVVGNAALAKNEIAYDSIDNAALTPEQVAKTILDMLDRDVMPGLGVIEIPVLGNLDLTSIDRALSSVHSLLGKGILGFLAGGDAQVLIDNRGYLNVQRSGGDLNVFYALLGFLGNDKVAGVLGKLPWGILTSDGINIGGLNGLVGGLVDLGDINDIVTNLSGFVTNMVFDMLLYGSYDYPSDAETLGTLPAKADTLDEIVNEALLGFLTKPQDYEWVPTGQVDAEGNSIDKKDWDESSYILDASKLNGVDLSLANNSLFTILDKALPIAYESFGTVVLNHDVKKIFMEAMGVDFVKVTDQAELAKIKADPDYIDVDEASADKVALVKNYLCNAQMWEVDGVWYFRDYVSTPTGEVDEEGNPITKKQHRFQRAEAYNVDELYNIFNWNYNLTASSIDFRTDIPKYGSFIGCLNHILHVILENAVSADYLAKMGTNIDALWADGGNDMFNENIVSTAKFVVTNFAYQFFGKNSPYVDADKQQATDEFKAKIASCNTIESLVAYIGLPFLADVLPQLVYDVELFTPGLEVEQTAALLVREFLSDLTPQINDMVCDYDAQIFADPTLASGRAFVTHTSEEWLDIVLNMGLDLAAIYLDNIANFGVDLNTLKTLHTYATGSTQPWEVVLEEIVDWAVSYVGKGNQSVLKGLEPSTLGSVRCVTAYNHTNDTVTVANNHAGNAFDILSKALNTILPLGLLCGVSDDAKGYPLSVEKVFNVLVDLIDDLNLEALLGVFGRNGRSDNILGTANLPKQILTLVNKLLGCVFGKNLLAVADQNTLANILTNNNLKNTIIALFTGLNSRKEPLLVSALPVVAVFVEDWGSEQELRSPTLSISETTRANGGQLDYTVSVNNGSKGLWRGYMKNGARVRDEQYAYEITAISSAQGRLTIGGGWNGKLDYGATKSFKITGTVPAEGISDKITVTYKVYNEDGALMNNGKEYNKSYYTYFSYEDAELRNNCHGSNFWGKALEIDTPQNIYYAEEDLEGLNEDAILRYYNEGDNKQTGKLTNSSGTQNGITLNNGSWEISATTNMYPIFTFNRAAYQSVGHAGAKYTFSYKLHNGKDDASFSTNVFVYSGADFGQLSSLVEDEVGMDRNPTSYSDAGAYTNYLGALANAMAIVYNPRVDANFWTNAFARYTDLTNAITALEASELTPEQQAAAGGDSIDAAVATLKAKLDQIEKDVIGTKDYRTFMLYRFDRYKAARNDANYIINLQEEVKAGAPTKSFPYTNISQAKLESLAAGDAAYGKYYVALLEDLTEEDKTARAEEFENKKKDYYSHTSLDVAQMQNLIERMSQRLVLRTTSPIKTYLTKEITSAKNEIGTAQGNYSPKSWAAYANALSNAEAVVNSASQDEIFAAKYALQVARNNLRMANDEASYDELQALIDQAQYVFQNAGNYKNDNKDFGLLLAALGYEVGGVNLFPGGAKNIINESIAAKDQDEIDDKADELKKALARMEFNGANYGSSNVQNTDVITGEVDEEGIDIKESVRTTKLGTKQLVDAVKTQFQAVTATNAGTLTVNISLDNNYSLTQAIDNKFVGTGAVITIYSTTAGGLTIPLSTIKVVVDGDLNGDGVVDVLDCMMVELANSNNVSLTGVYNLAGDLQANGKVDNGDLSAVANIAMAG